MITETRLLVGDWSQLGASAYKVRYQVFVIEQHVPLALEHDEADLVSLHVVATSANDEPIATGRLLPDGHIGRVAVLPMWRNQGVGRSIMLKLLDEATKSHHREVLLNAQVDAERFYTLLGFKPEGDVFMEAGIAHQAMKKTL